MRNEWTSKWKLQPVRRCCSGSINERVAPAHILLRRTNDETN
jgi:hypothetical protein